MARMAAFITGRHICLLQWLTSPSIRLTRSLATYNPQVRQSTRGRQRQNVEKDTEQVDKADEFGTLAPQPSILNSEYLPDDEDGYDTLEKMSRMKGQDYYERKFVELRYRGGPNRAKEMYQLWTQMKKEDRINKPSKNLYSLIVTTMAKSGLTDKAFYLFEELNRTGQFPTPSMITSLFNACALSYDRDEGLSYANYLRDWIYEKSYVCKLEHYNAMIKAYARHGDLKMAFAILKEMASFGHHADSFTYNMLLQGAISDKKAGFSHAVRILRESMKTIKLVEPSLRQFLTCTAGCGIGSIDHLTNLFEMSEMTKLQHQMKSTPEPVSQLMLRVRNFNILTMDKIENPMELLPLLKIESFDQPHNRLALVGGLDGVIKLIEKYEIKLTIPLFVELLKCLPPQVEPEKELIEYMRSRKFDPQIYFFNVLIKRRAYRMADEAEVQEAIEHMRCFNCQPDIITFGAIALTSRTPKQQRRFLQNMVDAGFKVNMPIMNSLIKSSCYLGSYSHLEYLIRYCVEESISLQPKTIESILLRISFNEKDLLRAERNETSQKPSENLGREVEAFKHFWEKISNKILLEKPVHEREQFDFDVEISSKTKYHQFVKQMKERLNQPPNKR